MLAMLSLLLKVWWFIIFEKVLMGETDRYFGVQVIFLYEYVVNHRLFESKFVTFL